MRQMVLRLGNKEGIIAKENLPERNQPKTKKKKEDGVRQAEKILLTWMIEDAGIYDLVKKHITPEDFADPLFKDVAGKVYEQYENGRISPASIINDYEPGEEQNEVSAMFSVELSESLSMAEREKTLNDTVIKVKENSLNNMLRETTDVKEMQDIINRQMKLKQIHISL